MIVTTGKRDALLLELDEKCSVPISLQEALLADLEFPEQKYFRWHLQYRSDDPDEVNVEFGHGTLSPLQNIVLLLYRASRSAGDYVKLMPKYRFCPVLLNEDQSVVPLYEFVEVLDGITEYDKIKAELPGLSYAQINGALMFLRKVAQFNSADVDIDDLEDDRTTNDQNFIEELRQALFDQEKTRVLDFREHDNERAT
jgi:hypothetical protein